jgi:AcrR family transcriptional regulator
MIAAAFDTLQEVGVSGTSARAIASRGGFNQAQIFYYFGSVNELLVATLGESSRARLAAYREAVGGVSTVGQLFDAVEQRLRADIEAGHLKVLGELIGASATDPQLKIEVGALFAPWLELTEATVARLLGPGPLADSLSARQVAFVVLALFLGVQQMVSLTGDLDPVRQIFSTGRQLAPILDTLLGSTASTPIPSPALVAAADERS